VKCTEARRHFGAYWDDELTQAEREWLEVHFAACDACRADYEALTQTLEAVSSLPRVEVTPGLAGRALARARRASPAPDRLPVRATPRWIAVTAAASLLAIAGASVLQWSTVSIAPRSLARMERPVVREPVLVTPAAPARPQSPAATEPAPSTAVATVADSLFDPSNDIEFILDPVTLRKGRVHPASRLAPEKERGEQAVITF
jgi:anti-sigma factor RsiW